MQFQGGPVPNVPSEPSQSPSLSPQGLPSASPIATPQSVQTWDEPPIPRGRPSPWLVVLAIGGLGLGGFGLVKNLMDPKPRVVQLATPAQPSFFSEQSQMMREALNMAKEAQAMQREHMQMIQNEIQAHEMGEFPGFVDGGGGGE